MCALRGGIREGPRRSARNMPSTRSPMAANGGMRSYEELCRLIYPKTPGKPTRAQRHAVGRTLNGMTLPGTWTILEKLGSASKAWRWAVKPIRRNDGYGADSGPFRGNPCTAAFRPFEAFPAAAIGVRATTVWGGPTSSSTSRKMTWL
jgi:hypothetical protein